VELTKQNCYALLALGRITGGEESFLNVLDADDLVRLGLADRYGKGQFALTQKGHEALTRLLRANEIR